MDTLINNFSIDTVLLSHDLFRILDLKGGTMKARSRFIMLFLSLLMVFTIPVSQTFAQGVSLEKDLQVLDRDYETNLDLIKLQLDSQDMM